MHPVYFAHANVFHYQGKPVPIELSIATIPSDGSYHGESCRVHLHTPRNAIHEHERFRLVHAPLPKSVPWNTYPFA
ncbi:hypothetical protein TNCV_1688751 [Trichonephila clavipes]|nr:hypothetical protein TNCV_1688751 [Trichonephila clavipes]